MYMQLLSRNRTIQWPTLNSETAAATICDQSQQREGRFNIIWKRGQGPHQ